jgi:hypothetical protein
MSVLRSASRQCLHRVATKLPAASSLSALRPSSAAALASGTRSYHAKVIDHYERPRNVCICLFFYSMSHLLSDLAGGENVPEIREPG